MPLESSGLRVCCLRRFFKLGYAPDVTTFTTLINGFILDDNIDKAVELFTKLIKYGDFKPNEVTYATIIKGLCKIGNTTMAIRLPRSMQKWNYKPDIVMYNTIIDSLCKDGNVDDALSLLSEIRKWDIMPNVVTYNSLILGLCNSGWWQDAERILRDMT